MGEKNGNGGFLRTVFWALLVGSFGWTTFVGYGLAQGLVSQAQEHKKDITELRYEISTKLDKLLDITTEIKTDVAGTKRQVEVNTRRLDRLETK